MIAIINYGMGNLRSVAKAIEFAGGKAVVTDKKRDLAGARALVLPGVGAFGAGMKNLKALGLVELIVERVRRGVPLLGICLGYQLLFEKSCEHGTHRGLGILKGTVEPFTRRNASLRIPHMGWNSIAIDERRPLFRNLPKEVYVYFVHSYYCVPKDASIVTSRTAYGVEFAASVRQGNIYGLQFHPEKSSTTGNVILGNFVSCVGQGASA